MPGATQWTEAEVKRTQVGILGLDIAQISGARACAHALATGDLVRIEESVKFDEVQWPFKRFFNISRFGSPDHGRFMPMRPEGSLAYVKSHKELSKSFAEGAYPELERHAKEIARCIKDPENLPSDKVLGALFVHAMADRFGIVPDEIIDASDAQTRSIVDVFKPWVFIPARPALAKIFLYTEKLLAERHQDKELEVEGVTDFSHPLMTPFTAGPKILKAISQNPQLPADKLFTELALVEEVLRMTNRDTTLGGMFPEDNPIKARKTIIRFNINKACLETRDLAYAFGSGTDRRRCIAEPEILRLFEMVRLELIRIRA